jgi:mono/diheme cytochrome c family protein
MINSIRPYLVVVLAVTVVISVCLAQKSGEATYTSKCAVCHGADGMARTSIGIAWKVKPVTDASVGKMELAEMLEVTRNGKGKMQSFKDKLSDAELRASVNYFRSLIK